MSDNEWECTSNTSATSAKGDEAFARKKAGLQKGELNAQLIQYIDEWRKTREKEEDELRRLKEKQAKRKEIRAEQEKLINQKKKEDEDKLKKEEADKRAVEAEEKRKRLEEAEAKRQQMIELQKAKSRESGANKQSSSSGGGAMSDARREMSKTREQLEEEKTIALSVRIKPLDLDGMDSDELKSKANELFNIVVQLETDKYDYEQRTINQDYELMELKERQKIQLRQKAVKRGLDPETLLGKHPPKVRMYSKYERRTDTRTYEDRKTLYEGGWEVLRGEILDAMWKEKYADWSKRPMKKLPKWFGERPGKKAGEPETPEGEEGGTSAPYEEPEVEEDEEDYDEEEEEEEEEEE